MNVKAILDSKMGSIIISIILGLGLAAMFRKACKDNRCIMIKGPKMEDVDKYYYKINSDCYKYSPVIIECNEQST